MGVEVIDVWRIFMELTGWKSEKEGEVLPGSIGVERSEVLGRLLSDGEFEFRG